MSLARTSDQHVLAVFGEPYALVAQCRNHLTNQVSLQLACHHLRQLAQLLNADVADVTFGADLADTRSN